ncbi:MAG: PDZ domain-containing protein, partial [Planctomycetes bacterium]|nr:PDZ domain-containing protein [Planctomycetota bacterium]
MLRYMLAVLMVLALAHAGFGQQVSREEKVRKDRKEVLELGEWYYNDLEAGRAEARRTGKPLLVIFRCIPCHACEGFDGQVLDRDATIRAEMDKFVCVRIVKANAMDLAQFQFDYDLSFAAFFMHPDGTIYGRFGTRSDMKDAEKDISLDGFRKALAAAMELHKGYPDNRELFEEKTGPKPEFAAPEQFPSLKGKYKSELNYEGNVVASCIHCHQIRDAERELYRSRREPAPDRVVYPWPLPSTIGLALSPRETASVMSVEQGSAAERAGLKPGDQIVRLDGQPLLSIADVQWVLHRAEDPDTLPAEIRRGDQTLKLSLELPEGWRAANDISWRATSWNLRRLATGGLKLKAASPEARRRAGVAEDAMAIEVEHVGQY